jgi:hypothetical protein
VNLVNGSAGYTRIYNSAANTIKWTHDDSGNTSQSGKIIATGMNLSGQALFAEGTSSAPGISFNNDGAPDTGLYHINDGTFGVTCNTTTVQTFNGALVNTLVPARFKQNLALGTGNAGMYENGANQIRVRTGAAGADRYFDFGAGGDLSGGGGNLTNFKSMYLTDGTPSIGFTSNSVNPTISKTIRVNGGNNSMEWINSAYSNVIAALTDTGTFTASVIAQSSDETKKEDWQAVEAEFLTKLAKIEKVGMFNWIESKETSLGVGAQSLEKFLPAAVHTDNEGKKTVNYGGAAMVSVVELTKLVLKMESRIAELEAAR